VFAGHLAGPPASFCGLAGFALRWLFIGTAAFHFTKKALALEFLLQNSEGLVDVVIADENLQAVFSLFIDSEHKRPGADPFWGAPVRTQFELVLK